jgi:hypothetical protein
MTLHLLQQLRNSITLLQQLHKSRPNSTQLLQQLGHLNSIRLLQQLGHLNSIRLLQQLPMQPLQQLSTQLLQQLSTQPLQQLTHPNSMPPLQQLTHPNSMPPLQQRSTSQQQKIFLVQCAISNNHGFSQFCPRWYDPCPLFSIHVRLETRSHIFVAL